MKTSTRTSLVLLVFASSLVVALAQSLPAARPEDEGFSSERLAYMDKYYADEVDKGQLAGIVLLVSRHGKIVHYSAIGYSDLEKKQKMEKDTIFRFYSMTKPITTTALMTLYEEGRFKLNDPIAKYLPEFNDIRVLKTPDGPLNDTVPADHPPTMQDVMRHTAGFTHGLSDDAFDQQYAKAELWGTDVSLEEMMHRLAKIPLRFQPGTKWDYSVGPDVQARLVEVISGMPFDEFLQKRLFGPLGMRDTAYWLAPDKAARLASVYWMKDGKLAPIDEEHGHPDGDIFVFQPWSVNSYTVKHKRTGGTYGLAGTAEDYWRFAQMMLNGGELNGKRILSPKTVAFMAQDHLEPTGIPDFEHGLGFGLGFAVMKNEAAAGYMNSEGSFFWSGAAATHFWIDPKEDLVVVSMTQHMKVPAADPLESQLRMFVYSAMTAK